MKKIAGKSFLTIFLAAIILLAAGAWDTASAHRMRIYAWMEGNRVTVECGFSRSQPVIGGEVAIYDTVSGKELLKGRTNQAGTFSFAVPEVVQEGHGLRIEVSAGQGHTGSWIMEAAELYEAASAEAGLDRVPLQENALPPAAQDQPANAAGAPGAEKQPVPGAAVQPRAGARAMPATREEVQAIVNHALDSKLEAKLDARFNPINRRLAAMEDRGIGITEVFGGLGWLIGLFGVWFYYRGNKS